MRKEASLPVRLDQEMKLRIQNAAQTMGITPSALIRILVISFVEEFERSGGKMTLPPQCQKDKNIDQMEPSLPNKAVAPSSDAYKIRRSGGKSKT